MINPDFLGSILDGDSSKKANTANGGDAGPKLHAIRYSMRSELDKRVK